VRFNEPTQEKGGFMKLSGSVFPSLVSLALAGGLTAAWGQAIFAQQPKAGEQSGEGPPLVLQEKFDQPSARWPHSDKCYVAKGKYYANGECQASVGSYVWDNFELSVVATVYTGGERQNKGPLGVGSEDVLLSTVALAFRANSRGYYRLLIAPLTGGKEGVYKLIKVVEGQKDEETGWRRDVAISMRNEIKLRCVGEKIELRINAQRVADFKAPEHQAGQISLLFSGGLASFDDLVIKQLK
jgi:hypothetical protein